MIFHYEYRGQVHRVDLSPGAPFAIVDGVKVPIAAEERPVIAKQGRGVWVHWQGKTYALKKTAALGAGAQQAHGELVLRAPMPGQVRQVLVTEGQAVEAGQALVLLEAMKMEIRIQAPQAAKVARVAVSQGTSVEKEQTLVELEA